MPTDEIELRLLLDGIFLRYHYDFRHYAMGSLRRRVQTSLPALGCGSISELLHKVLHDGSTFTRLLQYLTVQVSDFFREPAFFKVFRDRIVPVLATYPSIRLWVAGCGTGEEAYSFAILLREEGLLERATIYATDISARALEKAEAGIYAIDRVPGFTENHRASGATCSLSDYYSASYGWVVFDRALRSRVVFSDHSLATDSVFAEMHVVSCRNVLIYFDRELQNRALGLVKDALVRRGFLGLGQRETPRFTAVRDDFEAFEEESRWYRRR